MVLSILEDGSPIMCASLGHVTIACPRDTTLYVLVEYSTEIIIIIILISYIGALADNPKPLFKLR